MSQSEHRLSISGVRHPDYQYDRLYWEIYRDIFEGGLWFRDRYMQKLSTSESDDEFKRRKSLSPIPSFAKQAVLEIRNSIFQRLPDVTRLGGTSEYAEAMLSNVDRKFTGMNQFMGINLLTELLVIGKVGVYVDAPNVLPTTLAEDKQKPYLYYYRAEDILSWVPETEENAGQFKAVLLRDRSIVHTTHFGSIQLPQARKERFRLIYRDEVDNSIRVKIFEDGEDGKDQVVFLPNSEEDGSVILRGLPFVPFVMMDIGDSLLKDVWSYQVTLLNIMSGAANFDISANVPFLTIQDDMRAVGSHLKQPGADKGAETDNQISGDRIEKIGSTRGRYYDKGMERPDFVAPPSDSLTASLQHQEKLQDDIRKLVNLAVEGKAGSRTESGEAKKLSAQSFEAGLSFIGTVLQTGEQQIANIWAHYENVTNPQVAKVAYPSRYSIKTDAERIEESDRLMDLADKSPSKTAKREIYKKILALLLEDKVKNELLQRIFSEVDNAKYTRTDLDFIVECRKEGLVSDETASEALGFARGEVEKAKDDHQDRLERIAISQAKGGGAAAAGGDGPLSNPAGRGIPDLDANTDSGKDEQAAGRENNQENPTE